jgi:hypothetical protein
MRLFSLPNGRIEEGERAAWITPPFDAVLRAVTGPGLEHTLPPGRLHHTLPTSRAHHVIPDGRLHHTIPREG